MGNFLGGSKIDEHGVPKRTGVGGAINGILETIGDAVLVDAGLKPVFGPQHHQNRINTIRDMNPDDPEAMVSKIARIDPSYAQQLAGAYNKDALSAESRILAQQRAELASEKADRDALQKGINIWSALQGSITDDDTLKLASPILEKIKQTYNLGDEFTIPAKFDPAVMSMGQRMGQTSGQQVNSDISKDRLEESKRAAGVREKQADRRLGISATRANAPKSYKPTEAAIVQDLIDKEASGVSLTKGEQARVKKFTEGTRGERGVRRRRASGASSTTTPSSRGGKLVIRNGKLVQQ